MAEPTLADLHRDVQALISMHRRQSIRHGWLRLFVSDLETNPHTQYRVHFYGTLYWLLNFPLVVVLFFAAPVLWLRVGVFITLVYSIYANLATDYGAMSSAMAAFEGHGLPEIPAAPLDS